MTAVLAASDIMARDRHMSFDDAQYEPAATSYTIHLLTSPSYSPGTDWRAKYHEVRVLLLPIGLL